MGILGSREQMCIHEKVRTLQGSAQNNACYYLRKKRSCRHHCLVSGASSFLCTCISSLPCLDPSAFLIFFPMLQQVFPIPVLGLCTWITNNQFHVFYF